MSQPVQKDVFKEIKDFIDQSYDFHGHFSPNLNPNTKMELCKYVFCLFLFNSFPSFVIYRCIFNYIELIAPVTSDSSNGTDKARTSLYLHIKTCLQDKVESIYQVSFFLLAYNKIKSISDYGEWQVSFYCRNLIKLYFYKIVDYYNSRMLMV